MKKSKVEVPKNNEMKDMKQNNEYNNGPRRRYVPKKCSEKMDESGRTKMSFHA